MAGVLLQIVVIWGIVLYIIKKKKSGPNPGGGQTPNTTVHTAGSNVSNQQRPQVPMQMPPVKAVTKVPQAAEEESTTAYLAKKAQEDARQHAKEKWEEEKRLRETRGGLTVAERHLDGDPIPQGSRCVVCGYCAAENLVPMIPRTRYSCYFCREPLN